VRLVRNRVAPIILPSKAGLPSFGYDSIAEKLSDLLPLSDDADNEHSGNDGVDSKVDEPPPRCWIPKSRGRYPWRIMDSLDNDQQDEPEENNPGSLQKTPSARTADLPLALHSPSEASSAQTLPSRQDTGTLLPSPDHPAVSDADFSPSEHLDKSLALIASIWSVMDKRVIDFDFHHSLTLLWIVNALQCQLLVSRIQLPSVAGATSGPLILHSFVTGALCTTQDLCVCLCGQGMSMDPRFSFSACILVVSGLLRVLCLSGSFCPFLQPSMAFCCPAHSAVVLFLVPWLCIM
jgi:hypothetical protein